MTARTPERDLVSILIPVFNNAPYLAEGIDSVLAQSHRPLEIVVADDGSTDGTGAVARGYGDAVRYDYQPHAGQGITRNRAVRLASGEFVAFLDADDRFRPDKLEIQLAALRDHPDVDMVFGRVSEFVSPELTADERQSIRPPAPPTAVTGVNLMLIRHAALARVGPFSETLHSGVTIDWYARAIDAGLRGLMLPEVVLERRLHLANNGLRQRDSGSHYLRALKDSLDRRRAQTNEAG
jgi:glycosyltransferase involved in cell wall biosynthesis